MAICGCREQEEWTKANEMFQASKKDVLVVKDIVSNGMDFLPSSTTSIVKCQRKQNYVH